jgi:thioredoxin 2
MVEGEKLMPVLVNPKICVDREHCFAASACPYGAFYHNALKRTWEVDANICGDCPGPCLNFCDRDALRWGDDLVDLSFVKAELEGKMKPAEVTEARLKHKQELKEIQKKEEAQKRDEAARKSAEGVMAITRQNFEQEVLRAPGPVVVDCWADWCAPCKQFSPIFEATAKQYAGMVKFAKLDTEAEGALASGLGVQSLPTILLFYKGQIVNAAEGALPAPQFQEWLYRTLAAVRQFAAQLESEAEEAIKTATDNLRQLNAISESPAGEGAEPGAFNSPSTPAAPQPPQPPQQSQGRPDDPPGKRTSSGLYIP